MITLTDEQILIKLEQRLQETREVIEFATKRDKLDLYRAAEIDFVATARCIELLKAVIEAKIPAKPSA